MRRIFVDSYKKIPISLYRLFIIDQYQNLSFDFQNDEKSSILLILE